MTDGGNWLDGTVPDDTKCILIPFLTAPGAQYPIVDDNVNGEGYSLTLEAGASLTLNSDIDADTFGSSLTLQDYIDVDAAATLTVQDGASLIQVLDSSTPTAPTRSNSGNITLDRNTNIRLTDYVYWSSPVQGFDVSNVYGAFSYTLFLSYYLL